MGTHVNKLFKNWDGHVFESSTRKTDEFKGFARDFKKAVKEQVGPEWSIEAYSVGHFYISGFLKHRETGNYAYFSISDVRHFQNEWTNHMLIRTAKDTKDFTGGSNRYANFDNLKTRLESLL